MTFAKSAPGWPIIKGIQTLKEVSYLNMRTASAAAALNKLWSDTFLTNAGIDAGNSSGYTYQGTPNFNVVKTAGSAETQATNNDSSWSLMIDYPKCCQTFTHASQFIVQNVIFALKKNGAPTGNIKVKIYAVDGTHKPTGPVLEESTTVFDISTLTGAYANITFTFPGVYVFAANTEYAAVIEGDGVMSWPDLNNNVFYGNNSAGGYANGIGGYMALAGNAWTMGPFDFAFTVNCLVPQAIIRSVRALDLAANISQALVFADITLNGGTGTCYISTDDGTTFAAITPEVLTAVTPGKQIKLKVVLTGAASLESWGVAV